MARIQEHSLETPTKAQLLHSRHPEVVQVAQRGAPEPIHVCRTKLAKRALIVPKLMLSEEGAELKRRRTSLRAGRWRSDRSLSQAHGTSGSVGARKAARLQHRAR